MFGTPTKASPDNAVFHLVWTYTIKAADNRKKARCVCDGSTQSGHVRILDETYANCVDQTGSRLFYTCSQPARTSSSSVPAYQTHSPKPLRPNKASLFGPTVPSMNGGPYTNNAHPSPLTTSSQSTPLCKDTLNRPAFGKNTPTASFETLA